MCWAPYRTLGQALAQDPAFGTANPLLVEIDHPSGARYPAPGAAATIPGETRRAPVAAPVLGRDTDEVLGEILGLSESEIARLRDAGLAAGPS